MSRIRFQFRDGLMATSMDDCQSRSRLQCRFLLPADFQVESKVLLRFLRPRSVGTLGLKDETMHHRWDD
jgi:hypothetical protein